jgi:hypothetical protein
MEEHEFNEDLARAQGKLLETSFGIKLDSQGLFISSSGLGPGKKPRLA